MEVLFPLELQQGSWASSQVAAEIRGSSLVVARNLWLDGELPQCLRVPFEVQQEISVPLDLKQWMQDSTGVMSWKSGNLLQFWLESSSVLWSSGPFSCYSLGIL